VTNSAPSKGTVRAKPIYRRRVTFERQALGRIGEALVVGELRSRGWRVLARNARPKTVRGELDLIAWDGRDVVFVEVKTAREGATSGPPNPAEMVGRRKQAKLRQLAGAWIRENRGRVPRGAGMRIDVVAQRLDGAGRVVWREHIRAAV
jgi:putative endonuclease